MKLYFQKNDENCWPLSYHYIFMENCLIDEMEVFEAEVEYGTGHYYCKEYFEVGEVGDGRCGKSCEGYSPRNGKNGRCRHSGHLYSQTGKSKTLNRYNKNRR